METIPSAGHKRRQLLTPGLRICRTDSPARHQAVETLPGIATTLSLSITYRRLLGCGNTLTLVAELRRIRLSTSTITRFYPAHPSTPSGLVDTTAISRLSITCRRCPDSRTQAIVHRVGHARRFVVALISRITETARRVVLPILGASSKRKSHTGIFVPAGLPDGKECAFFSQNACPGRTQ